MNQYEELEQRVKHADTAKCEEKAASIEDRVNVLRGLLDDMVEYLLNGVRKEDQLEPSIMARLEYKLDQYISDAQTISEEIRRLN